MEYIIAGTHDQFRQYQRNHKGKCYYIRDRSSLMGIHLGKDDKIIRIGTWQERSDWWEIEDYVNYIRKYRTSH